MLRSRTFRCLQGLFHAPSFSLALALFLANSTVFADKPNPRSAAPASGQLAPPTDFPPEGGGRFDGKSPGGQFALPTEFPPEGGGVFGKPANSSSASPETPSSPANAPNGDLQKRIQELQNQQEKLANEYQDMMKALQQTLPPSVQLDLQRRQLQKRYAEVQAQLSEQLDKQLPSVGASLPDNAAVSAFTLKYVRPEDIGQALHNITGAGGPRIAVDERTNTLLIAGSDNQVRVAKQLVDTLDQPGQIRQAVPEVLQLRIVWLSEGMTDRLSEPPSPSIISLPVTEALRELGMELPQVVCQQMTSLTLSPTGPGGKYRFRVPTQIEDSTWEFQGEGIITPTADNRYAMDFNLSLMESGAKNPQPSQLSGSILTPLSHYTVMGTTTFVAPSKDATVSKLQRLSAFVVYLDRPKDFGDAESSPTAPKKADKRNK